MAQLLLEFGPSWHVSFPSAPALTDCSTIAAVVAAVAAVDAWLEDVEGRRAVAWLAVLAVLHGYLGHHFTAMGSFGDYMDRMVPMYASEAAVRLGLVRVAVVAALFAAATFALLRGDRGNRAAASLP